MSVLQSANYKAYVAGRHERYGPSLNQIKSRFMLGDADVGAKKHLVDLTSRVFVDKQEIFTPDVQRVEQKSVKHKRINVDARIVLEALSGHPNIPSTSFI